MVACWIDISDGAKQGQVLLALPERSVPSELAPSLPATDAQNTAGTWLDVPAELTVELTRISLPFEADDKMRCGDLLPPPKLVMDHVKVWAQTSNFQASAYLGQAQGQRAVGLALPSAARGPHRITLETLLPQSAECAPPILADAAATETLANETIAAETSATETTSVQDDSERSNAPAGGQI